MKTLSKIILIAALVGGFSQCANALETGISAGTVNKIGVAGAYVKHGNYSIDFHGGSSDTGSAISTGIYRKVLDLKSLSLGVGLDANQSTTKRGLIIKTKKSQGYGLEINKSFGKFKMRSTINSNGDFKLGIGLSF